MASAKNRTMHSKVRSSKGISYFGKEPKKQLKSRWKTGGSAVFISS